MSLHFPSVETIYLGLSPLREVICQVKFPSILSIAHEEPAQFQQEIRKEFPFLDVEHGVLFELEAERPSGRVKMPPPTYHFSTTDRTYKVSLSDSFFALSTIQYQGWGHFAKYLAMVIDAVQRVYDISVTTRIGLRYINMLDERFTETGQFDDVLNIVRNELTVMARTDVIQDPVLDLHRIETKYDKENFSFQFGIINEGSPPAKRFILDFDCFAQEESSLNNLLERCNQYHKTIYQAFRWCIIDSTLAVFQPQM